MFYIMRAYHLKKNPGKIALQKCIDDAGTTGTTSILVCLREDSVGRRTPAFVMGSGEGYQASLAPQYYTIDTGNGHRAGGQLVIQDIVVVRKGKVVKGRTDHLSANPWVMK